MQPPTLVALTDKGEARVRFGDSVFDENYLALIRDYLADTFLDGHGSYPGHLSRWRRIAGGGRNVDRLLLLADPEAVVAVAHSSGISATVAGYAWWACQSFEIAVGLLSVKGVAKQQLGKDLARYITEFLPFQEDPVMVARAVSLINHPELLSREDRQRLFSQSRRRNPYSVGFFLGESAYYPDSQPVHPLRAELEVFAQTNNLAKNAVILTILELLSPPGQNSLVAMKAALSKPVDREVVTLVFSRLETLVAIPGLLPEKGMDHSRIDDRVEKVSGDISHDLGRVRQLADQRVWRWAMSAARLSLLGESVLDPIFAGKTFSGSVMRKHLLDLTNLVTESCDPLLKPV